jgi:hypothetical protein
VVLRLTPPGADGAAPTKRSQEQERKRARINRRQRLRKRITVKVACVKPCASVAARGRLVIKRSKRTRRFKVGHARGKPRAGVVVLRLAVPTRAWRIGRKALKQGAQVRARVIVTSRSARGAKLKSAARTIALRRN